MKNLPLPFFLLVLFTTSSFNFILAQNDSSVFKNRIYAELGGPCGHYSLSYERRVYEKRNKFLSVAVGFSPSLFTGFDDYSSPFTPRLSFQIKNNIKFKKNYFEYGLALTNYLSSYRPFRFRTNRISLAILPLLGYSRDISNKFNIGLYFTPLVYEAGYEFTPWGAVRIAYRLN